MKNILLITGLLITIILHYITFVILTLSPFVLFSTESFLVAFLISVLVLRISFSRDICPLSYIECKFEKALGFPRREEFMKNWVVNYYDNWKSMIKDIKNTLK